MIRNRELKQELELIKTILLVSNPDSPVAAEAYDGLRKTIVGSIKATQVLEASLAQLDQISRSTDDMQDIRIKLRELMAVAKVELVVDYDRYRDAFDVIGSGSVQTVTKPAYVAVDRGAVVTRGVLELSAEITEESEVAPEVLERGAEVDDDMKSDSGAPVTEERSTSDIDSASPADEERAATSAAVEGDQI
jgi:hypothetical protein